jgi:chaperonin GroEL
MNNEILYSTNARTKLISGINAVANSVKVTMGARGRNVIIGRINGRPHTTQDGVTVAKAVFREDAIESIGVELMKEVAEKTVDISGDGTTAATILAQAIVTNGIKAIESGCNPIDIKSGIEKGVAMTGIYLKEISKPVDSDILLKQIATVSANNDNEIGGLIAEVFSKIGKDGVVTVEESKTSETKISLVDGMKIERGYISHHFVTNQEKMQVELDSPHILLYDKKISSLKDVLHLLESSAQSKRPLLIIAEDVEGEALASLVVNKLRGIVSVCAIKCPDFGENRKHSMGDIAVLIGGEVVSEEDGGKIDAVKFQLLGQATKVIVDRNSCLIIGGNGKKEEIAERCNQINAQIEESNLEHDKQRLKVRVAKLKNGVAVLSVGGITETEIGEKKDRVDDSLCATRAAIEEGFLLGGGVSLLHASNKISVDSKSEDEKTGFNILKKSLESCFRQILENAGLDASACIKDILGGDFGIGINVLTNKLENLFEAGIIDPTKVVRVALENAASIACMILTTECVIPYPKENATPQYNLR